MTPALIVKDEWTDMAFSQPEDHKLKQDVNNYWYTLGCLIGIVLMSFALIIHLMVPNFRNVRGYKICFLLLGMESIYFAHLAMNTQTTLISCQAQGYFYAYAVIFSVFWLNVLCFDCFALYRTRAGNSAEKNRFTYACLYGWGGPAVLALFSLFMERVTAVDRSFKPNFSTWACHYESNKTVEFLYYFLPLLMLMISGLVFLMTSVFRARVLRLVPRNVVRFDRSKDHKRLLFTLRLFVAVAVAYALDISSWLWNGIQWIQWVSSFYMYVLAIMIFLLCMCNSHVEQWFAEACC
ncbi:probable G-protein coupled receptor Mth-like 1 [Armigeres subalbatus]|uniref:probable G-protein coupled receptor Mth-like 1 n=1 Tax=Armigeres subalbatus TaxID=124917 RepID=UPI002ED304A5